MEKKLSTGKSIPTGLSFRFNAQDEELEELYPEDSGSTTEESTAASTPTESFVRDSSPSRRSGKRTSTTSVDSSNVNLDTSTTDHPWSFLHGIREKIEDKIDEIKKERQQKANEKKLSLSKHAPSINEDIEGFVNIDEFKEVESSDEKKTEQREDKKRVNKDINDVENKDKEKTEKEKKITDKDKETNKDKKDTQHQATTTPSTQSQQPPPNKMKFKFSDLKKKFNKSDADLPIGGIQNSLQVDSDSTVTTPTEDYDDIVEVAEEAGFLSDNILDKKSTPEKISSVKFRRNLAFSSMKHTSCRTPGVLETLGTMCSENLKLFVLAVALVGLYCSLYPLLVTFLLGALFAMEIQSILDWIKETFFVWTDSNSDYLITTNPFQMTQPVAIFDTKSMKPIPPHKQEYVGWVNEFKYDYSPEKYHLSLTETVYIQLQGSMLKISEPRIKIPKRAIWNEPQLKLLFNVARLYNISNCEVVLLPKGIIRQRVWNRKYPICIILRNDSHVGIKFRNKDQTTIVEEEPWHPFEIPDTPQHPGSQTSHSSSGVDPSQGKVKSKSTDSFLTLHENLKLNLEKINKQESTSSGTDLNAQSKSSKEDADGKPNIPIRRKRSSLKKEDEIKEENVGEDMTSEESKEICDATKSVDVPEVPKTDFLSDDEAEPDEDDESYATDMNFHVISGEETKVQCLYLFARTDRDKELWYRRLKSATSYYSVESEDGAKTRHFQIETDNHKKSQVQSESYIRMMANLNQTNIPTLPPANKETPMPRTITNLKDEGEVNEQLMWINAILGRTLFDVFRNQSIRNQIQNKLQKKLNAIRLPRFLGQLNISKLEFSNNSPIITQAFKPSLDENGIWFELDLVFEGVFRIQVDTKLMLMNLKRQTKDNMSMLQCDNNSNSNSPTKEQPSKLAALHSDIEDSGETSSDNDEKRLKILSEQNIGSDISQMEASAGLTPNRMLRMVDRITNTKMFDKITDNSYVKKLMEDVASKDISLFVELQGLAGRVVVNIPPPPSDRLWYGFKGNPRLWLTAYPKFGDTELSYISNLLQKVMCTEFQKVIVLPNMDDLVLDALVEDPLS